jgi:hypothetical protein
LVGTRAGQDDLELLSGFEHRIIQPQVTWPLGLHRHGYYLNCKQEPSCTVRLLTSLFLQDELPSVVWRCVNNLCLLTGNPWCVSHARRNVRCSSDRRPNVLWRSYDVIKYRLGTRVHDFGGFFSVTILLCYITKWVNTLRGTQLIHDILR